MPGFSNNVMYADNVQFNGNSEPASVTADGQLLIGSSVAPNIRVNTLTQGTGITITNGNGTITIANSGSLTDLHVARFIVSAGGSADGANFTTIASAYAAAVAATGVQTVFIQPGSYTENLTLSANVNLAAFDCDALTPTVTIIGTLTATFTGSSSISGIRLQTNSAAALVVSGSNATVINLKDCFLNCTNNTGITFSTSSSSAQIFIEGCRGNLGTTGIAFYSQSSPGVMTIRNCVLANNGSSTTTGNTSSGTTNFVNTSIQAPCSTSSTGILMSSGSIFTTLTSTTNITMAGTNSGEHQYSSFSSGSASCVSVGTGCSFIGMDCIFTSSNANCLTGAGTISLSNATYRGTSANINVTAQSTLCSTNTVRSTFTDTSPYTVLSTDQYIRVDLGGNLDFTVNLPDAPSTDQRFYVKDSIGFLGTGSSITVTTPGGVVVIDQSPTFQLTAQFQCAGFHFNGIGYEVV